VSGRYCSWLSEWGHLLECGNRGRSNPGVGVRVLPHFLPREWPGDDMDMCGLAWCFWWLSLAVPLSQVQLTLHGSFNDTGYVALLLGVLTPWWDLYSWRY
jgi:hypothetical protein